jgi:chromosome segregation ATPase
VRAPHYCSLCIMSGKSAAIVRPSFETGHLLTFRTPRSAVSQSASLVGSSVLAGASPPGLNSMRSSAAPSPARVARSDSVALTTPRSDLAAGALMQKLLNDEHAVAAQNMSEMAGRRDISIMKLSDMCSLLRADLQSLEQENAQLSAKLRASETESQELRVRIGTMSQREALYQESVSQHANLQKEFSELRSREQVVALSLTQAERQRDAALQQLGQCKLETAAATDSAAHASTLMQAMECDLVSVQRAWASVQDSLAACAAERDALQLRLSQLQRELEVSAHSDAQNRIQVDLLKESVACSQELQARSDSIVLQLRQELQRQQQSTEHVSFEFQSEQMRAKALEEDSKALQLAHKDETDALQGRIHSDQVLLKQQRNEIFDLISARDAAQHKCDELQSNAVSLESSRADVYNALQAQISANAQYTAEIRELRHALDTLPSKQRDHFENELRRCRQASTGLQSQLDLFEQQSAEFSALCSSQQQSIHALTQKLEANTTERLALEMQLDSLRSRVQKHEAAYASLSQESQAQLSHLSDDAKQAHAKTNELRLALSDMTSRFNEISGALARAVVDLEVKDSELKSTAKQARTKSHQQEDSLSRLQDQYLKLQHESIENSSRLQQQLLAAEQSAASRASRIIALEEAISGKR